MMKYSFGKQYPSLDRSQFHEGVRFIQVHRNEDVYCVGIVIIGEGGARLSSEGFPDKTLTKYESTIFENEWKLLEEINKS